VVVGHQHGCPAGRPQHPRDLAAGADPQRRVEGGRLVEQDYPGPGRQGPREGDPLLLADPTTNVQHQTIAL
jgi:hypothetical protein